MNVQPVQQSFQKPSVTAKLTQSSSISQSSLISSNHEQSKSNPSVPITITGSSIVRDLEPGKLFVSDKHFDIKISTKHGASIKQLTHMVNNNWIDQHFNLSSHAIISIGSIDMKHINSDKAIELLNQLIQTLKRKHHHIKPTFVTIPPQFDPNLKPSYKTN
ncbi:unnamed protein product [Didymodactylos carnosus]|uniref:Uncharacterized protein n=1 Tax=Didymodactylos carnosus TaxID=1234261 RepID=A0A815F6A9_9BILA|nr:unnamed protein product [Didymodactylos carnosus]CAF4163882.1 unnamed protein product [Didymodactylos carnosus]